MDIDGQQPLNSLWANAPEGDFSPLPPPSCAADDIPMRDMNSPVSTNDGCGNANDMNSPDASRLSAAPALAGQSPLPATPAEECRLVSEQDQASVALYAGRSYCLLERRWHVEWLQWVGDQSVTSPKHGPVDMSPSKLSRERSWTKDRPGPIDNSSLMDPSNEGRLKTAISEHVEYEIVSEEVWALLHGWYGGGPVIRRRAIQLQPSSAVTVELYGITLQVYRSSDLTKSHPLTESKMTTVEALKKRICEEFGVEAAKVRIWDYFNKRKYANLEDSITKSLDNCRIYDNNDILLEEQLADGTWPPEEKSSYSAGGTGYWSSSYNSSEDVPTSGTPPVQGAAGLQNLGNTCFMNSSIQCMSSVPDLRQYFVDESYKTDLNEGAWKTKGKLAEAFSGLLKHIWNPTTTQVAPRNFKWQVGQFAEQFAGYGQQDSMEFIEYVLQGLMEDVNKVQGTKPFVELKEAEGRPDEMVAQEAQEGYTKRNNSRIDDLFTGFFKSTVSCPEAGCGRVSVKIDPFCSLKLSLVTHVEDRSQKFEVSVVLLTSPKVPIQKYTVNVLKSGNAESLIEAAAAQAGLKADSCFLAEIYAKKFYKIFEPKDAVDAIGANDILVLYELPSMLGSDRSELVIHVRQESRTQYNYTRSELLGIPLCASVSRMLSGRDLTQAVKAEFAKRLDLDSSFDGKFKLLHTREKTDVGIRESQLEADDERMDLGSRHFVVAEFEDGVVLPEVLTNMFQETPHRSYGGSSRAAPSITLERCFDMLAEEEKLSPEDTWYCSKCKEHREAFKKLEIWALPPVLVLQLKRFTYTTYTRDRLDTPVIFPLEGLDLSSMVLGPNKSGNCIYDLIASSKHMGGLGGGHYVAYSRSSENGKWYYYNDSSVTEASASEVAGDQVGAYVLFYIRRDRRPASWA